MFYSSYLWCSFSRAFSLTTCHILPSLSVLLATFVSFVLCCLSHTAIFSGHVQSFSTNLFWPGLCQQPGLPEAPTSPVSEQVLCRDKEKWGWSHIHYIFNSEKKFLMDMLPCSRIVLFHVVFVLPLKLMKIAAFGTAYFLTRLLCCSCCQSNIWKLHSYTLLWIQTLKWLGHTSCSLHGVGIFFFF